MNRIVLFFAVLPAVRSFVQLRAGGASSRIVPPSRTSPHQPLLAVAERGEGGNSIEMAASDEDLKSVSKFDLNTALFCGGLAFDAYTEPPSNSSRWERGSRGMNVAFVSTAFARNLYKGVVEVTPIKCAGLPDEDDNVEAVITGGGMDACLLVAAIEGQWKEDLELLKKEYHRGVLDLSGAAHVGRSSTAWANVDEKKSNQIKKKTGKAPPYHVKKGWGRDASAVWPEPEPFYLYLQDPANVRLVLSIFDEDVVGGGSVIGSTHTSLSKLLPEVRFSQEELVDRIKADILEKLKAGEISPENVDEEVTKALNSGFQAWEGTLKLISKPRVENKNGQVALGAAAGAMLAGPAGAAVGAAVGSFYEGQVKGSITLRLRYLPIPQTSTKRKQYNVLGGLPGVNWGELYNKYLQERLQIEEPDSLVDAHITGNDLEHCFFINHDETGGCCAVYRSLKKKLIVVSFRGTCEMVDLVTDASIVQEPWVSGEDMKNPETARVHVGFRKSMNSISRRLKELLLVTVAPGDNIADYDILVTGHSLGGALATLFIADIGEFGIDSGRALPQTDESDAWWKSIANSFMGRTGQTETNMEPPRPKSLRLYNFGSPRVGDKAFAKRFDGLVESGKIDQAYRIVNDQDVVARLPRTMGALSLDYDHVGSTVLVVEPNDGDSTPIIWVEKETDDQVDRRVRDADIFATSPLAKGTLLGDLVGVTQEVLNKDKSAKQDAQFFDNIGSLASQVGKRLSSMSASDIASVMGIDRTFTEREFELVQSLVKGEGLAHHMEDSYYAAMGRSSGFIALVGEDIVPIDSEGIRVVASAEKMESIVSDGGDILA